MIRFPLHVDPPPPCPSWLGVVGGGLVLLAVLGLYTLVASLMQQ